MNPYRDPVRAIADAAYPIEDAPSDYDPLLELVGDAHYVLLGEATHGTRDFYRERARITRQLITKKGFNAVAVEADWPDAYRVNRHVMGDADDSTALHALDSFRRFPTWMWRNVEVLEFVQWLREHNDGLPTGSLKTGFYGLDLYSLHGSIEAVLSYLRPVDAEAYERARERYSCFDHFGENTQAYGYTAGFGLAPSCEKDVLEQLIELRGRAASYAPRDASSARDEFFSAEQNAKLVRNAEEYYRSMFQGRVDSWNMRDSHMADTLNALADHLTAGGHEARIVVWEHNSHLGDARATDSRTKGELNVGQLVRQQHGADVVLIGFTTYQGTVTAAMEWDGPAKTRRVLPALDGSYEQLFHQVGIPRFLLDLRDPAVARALQVPRLERAIGVIYRPDTERQSHYFEARLAEQFDAVLHFDVTEAVRPLESVAAPAHDAPETFPSGI